MNPIRAYWQQIQRDGACDKLTRVYAKLIADMNDKTSIWEYDEQKASHAISFIEKYCRHSKGKLGGKPFKLELWQKAFVAAAFGFLHKIDGTRRFRQVLLVVARKNGKSMLGSALALYMQVADGESGPEIVSAATKREQAKIIWLESKRMVNKSPDLRRLIKPLVGELVSDFNDGSFKPLASDSNTLDGLNIHALLLDELHAIEDQNLLDVLVDGMSAREQPMSIITTTMGTVRESVFDLKYEECERIINGYNDPDGYHDERTLPIIYELDKRSEWTDPKCWHKANPGLGTIKSLEQLADKVRKAQSNPLLVKNLLCKDFNVRETTSEAWLTFEEIDNPVTFDLTKLKPRYGIGGADLSATTDLTAASVLFMVPDDPVIYHMQMFWLPEDLLDKRAREDKIPYDVWRDQGLLRTCPGNSVHAKYVTEWFQEVMNVHGIYIPWVGYDSWSAKYWVEEMATYFGVQAMVPVIQGKKTLSGPMKKLGADLGSKLINYGNNPITKWCLTNTSVEIDKNNNIQPAKGTSQRRRIDGTAAMLNAYVVLQDKIADYKNML